MTDFEATPFFSIGVTTFNRREMLRECLHSILHQTFADFEVIVGNDYTQEILCGEGLGVQDSRIRFVNHPSNLGEVRNMNYLLTASRGRYFTWLADDDLYAPVFLESAHTALLRFGFLPCLFTSYRAGATPPDVMETVPREGRLFDGRQFLHLYLDRRLKTQGCYGVFDRGYLERSGAIQRLGNGFSPYSDNLLAIRAGLEDTVVHIDAPLVFLRTHDQATSWVNADAEAYSSAQEDFCRKCVDVFRADRLQEDFRLNLSLLIRWCVDDFFSVMGRSRSIQTRRLIRYLLFLSRYIVPLGNYRYSMLSLALRRSYKAVVQPLRSRLKRALLRWLGLAFGTVTARRRP